jgi:hypothetical protein
MQLGGACANVHFTSLNTRTTNVHARARSGAYGTEAVLFHGRSGQRREI